MNCHLAEMIVLVPLCHSAAGPVPTSTRIAAWVPRPVFPDSIDHNLHVVSLATLSAGDEHLPYKNLIGTVLLDKNRSIKTVIRKVGTIANEYRRARGECPATIPVALL